MAELEALEKRRAIDIRHARFNSALVASILVNAHKSGETDPVSPFDFIAGFEEDEADIEKRKLRATLKNAATVYLCNMVDKSKEEMEVILGNLIGRWKEQIEDPEELIREIFPDWEF